METENKDKWTPEVGKTAWFFLSRNEMRIVQGTVEKMHVTTPTALMSGKNTYALLQVTLEDLFPTAEAALQSIKVYDLEGKEVVIPRARVDLPDHTHLLNHFSGVCTECGKTIELDPETWESLGKIAKLAYTMEVPCDPVAEERLRKAQERFSQDRREGGC